MNVVASTSKNTMPNVVGMGLKDAVYLLENKGLKLGIQGTGKVVNQSLIAGTNFIKGQKIILFLN
jgi:cell division protein FtsI (penicillin-binding protein 3)